MYSLEISFYLIFYIVFILIQYNEYIISFKKKKNPSSNRGKYKATSLDRIVREKE